MENYKIGFWCIPLTKRLISDTTKPESTTSGSPVNAEITAVLTFYASLALAIATMKTKHQLN